MTNLCNEFDHIWQFKAPNQWHFCWTSSQIHSRKDGALTKIG